MNKATPHYSLAKVKALIKAGKVRVTNTARRSAMTDFSLDLDELVAEVSALTMDDFYKSMTTYEDHTRWHNVYHKRVPHGVAYIKVQIDLDQTVVISFKEK